MRVFGMGTLASMASKERYLRFTHAMYGIYSTMEDQLDLCCPSINPTPHASTSTSTPPIPPPHPVAHFWTRHSKILRPAPPLPPPPPPIDTAPPYAPPEHLTARTAGDGFSDTPTQGILPISWAGRCWGSRRGWRSVWRETGQGSIGSSLGGTGGGTWRLCTGI